MMTVVVHRHREAMRARELLLTLPEQYRWLVLAHVVGWPTPRVQ